MSSFKIFHHYTWPLSSKELLEFGIQEVSTLCSWFQVPLEAAGCNIEAVPAEWRQLEVLVSNSFHDKSYADPWKIMLTKEPYMSEFANVLHLVEIMLE